MKSTVKDNSDFLHLPIQQLNASSEFKEMAKANRFETLQEILDTSLNDFPFRPLSGYRLLKELLDILEGYQHLNWIDDQEEDKK